MQEKPPPPTSATKPPSRLEWLPVAALFLLAVVYLILGYDHTLGRLSFFVGIGLIPGSLWRILGRSSWSVHRIFFAAALVAFMLVNPKLRPRAEDLQKILDNWHIVALGMIASFTQPLWGALRLRRLLNDSHIAIGLGRSLHLCLVGSFFNLILPGATGGDLYRVYAIADGARARIGRAVASVTLDRFLGLPPLILMVLIAAAFDQSFIFSHESLSGLITFMIAGGVVCLLVMAYLWLGRGRWDDEPEPGEEVGKLRKIHRLLVANVTRRSTMPVTLLHGLLSHIAVVLACILFGYSMGIEGIPALRYFLLVPLAMSINAIPGAPGGIGQGEIAMAVLFDMAAPDLGNAQGGVVVMLLFRLSSIAIGLAGGVCYAMGSIDRRQVKYDQKNIQSEIDQCP